MIETIAAWVGRNEALLSWIAAISATGALASVVLAVWVLLRIPVDYFARIDEYRARRRARHPLWLALWVPARNLLGALFLLAGLLMLFLPGQGLLTLLIGLMLVDLPGKHRAIDAILRRPGVLAAMNRVRRAFGRPPFDRQIPLENR